MSLPFPTSTRGKIGGAGGILGIIVLVVALFLSRGGGGGISGVPGLDGFESGEITGDAPPASALPTDEAGDFAAAVFSDVQDSWEQLFAEAGQQYIRSELILFEGSTQSGCGPASSATGPFYCPPDQKVYIDLGFYDQLTGQLGAQGGDFAQAYVTAHEVGHHVQNLLGINAEVQQLSADDPDQRNELSVRLELQADCFAGIWANGFTSRSGNVLEPGDIAEAMDAASAVGDDRIQQQTQGRINPESWTHGSSAQREEWFDRGYRSGAPEDCDTFSADL
jgi:predicted metalloprotease